MGQENRCSESNRKIRAGVIPKKQKNDKNSCTVTGGYREAGCRMRKGEREIEMRALFAIFFK